MDAREARTREVIARIQAGDREAIAELVAMHAPAIQKQINIISRNANGIYVPMYCEADREDARGEIVLCLIRAARKFDLDSGYKFSTYMKFWFKRAQDEVIGDRMRSNPGWRQGVRTRRVGDVEREADPDCRGEDRTRRFVEADDARHRVSILLASLPGPVREQVRMRFGVGRKMRDCLGAAKAAGCSKTTAVARLGLGLRMLKQEADRLGWKEAC